ncbi:holin [Flavobacterium rhizosphaerae]|uniref:Holin n=1 Tax=Flavobacterium rhizosphaerae TaxID=3163298 RepID=A0ABW8YZ37_9FLAO
MILDFVNGDLKGIYIKVSIVFFTWLVVLLAVGIDLYFGIKKSKSLGEITHSYGLRQTVQKIVNYLAMMLFMLLFDSISPLGLLNEGFNILPLASIIGAVILVWTEFLSVREKADEKYRRKTEKVARELLEIALKDDSVLNKLKQGLGNTPPASDGNSSDINLNQ